MERYDAWARRYAEYAEVGVTTVPDLVAAVRERAPTKLVLTSDADDVARFCPCCGSAGAARCTSPAHSREYLEFCDIAVSKSAALERARRAATARPESVRSPAATR